MKYTLDTPPSSTPQKVDIDISLNDDGRIAVNHTVTGTTPIVVPPPVVEPPVVEPPVTEGYELVYSNGYNKQSDLEEDNGQFGNGKVVTDVKTEGAGSFLSIPAGNTSNGYRSEDQFTNGKKAVDIKEGAVEYDVRYDYFIANNSHSVQFHPSDQRASAALALWHKSGYLVLGTSIGVGTANRFKPVLKRWYRFRIEYNFDNRNGYARWFIDGFLQAEIKGLPVSAGGGQYFKLGANNFNASAEDAKSRIYYDDLKIYKKV